MRVGGNASDAIVPREEAAQVGQELRVQRVNVVVHDVEPDQSARCALAKAGDGVARHVEPDEGLAGAKAPEAGELIVGKLQAAQRLEVIYAPQRGDIWRGAAG